MRYHLLTLYALMVGTLAVHTLSGTVEALGEVRSADLRQVGCCENIAQPGEYAGFEVEISGNGGDSYSDNLVKSKRSKKSKKKAKKQPKPTPSKSRLGLTPYESEHYRIETDIEDKVLIDSYLKVIEAEWVELAEYFGAEPKLKKGQKLLVNLLTTKELYLDKLTEDGHGGKGGSGGYCVSSVAYLYLQPTVYYSRQLFLHEVMHQFHWAATCNNSSLENKWYTEGIVEYFSRHNWDGEMLKMGIVPLSTNKNYPKVALEIFSKKDFRLAEMIDGKTDGERAAQWALVRYLQLSEDRKYIAGWKKLREKLDKGGDSKNCFRNLIDKPEVLQPKILDWLKSQREPFENIWSSWEPTGPDTIVGKASRSGIMASTDELDSISCTISPAKGSVWSGGLVLGFIDSKNFSIGYIKSDGVYKIKTVSNGNWSTIAEGSGIKSPTGEFKIRAERIKNGMIKFTVNKKLIRTLAVKGKRMGLYTDECQLEYFDIRWVVKDSRMHRK